MIRTMRSNLLWLGLATALLPTSRSALAANWLNPDWSRRVQLTARPELIGGPASQSDVTLALTLDAGHLSEVFDHARTDGADLVFTAGDGTTVIDHEIVSFDGSGRTAEVWFEAPLLSATENVFYMYYGNADTAVIVPPGSAWSDQHLAVYHFDQDPALGLLPDAGPAANPALIGEGSLWSSGDLMAGQLGRAWHFDDNTEWLYAEGVSSPDSSFTIGAWYANSGAINGGSCAFHSLPGYWQVFFQHNDMFNFPSLVTAKGFYVWAPAIPDTLMHQYVWTLDAVADTARFFFDGVEQPVLGYYAPDPAHRVYEREIIAGRIGVAGPVFYNSLDLVDGLVDEYRIVEGIRDPARILTEFNNQRDPAGFFAATIETGGTVDVAGSVPISSQQGGRITVWPNPSRGLTQLAIDLDSPTVRVAVYDVAGRVVRLLPGPFGAGAPRHLLWDGRDDRGTAVGNGIYYVRAVGGGATAQTKLLLIR